MPKTGGDKSCHLTLPKIRMHTILVNLANLCQKGNVFNVTLTQRLLIGTYVYLTGGMGLFFSE